MLAEGGGGTPPLLKISNFFFNPSLVDLDFIMKGVVISIKSRLKKNLNSEMSLKHVLNLKSAIYISCFFTS